MLARNLDRGEREPARVEDHVVGEKVGEDHESRGALDAQAPGARARLRLDCRIAPL
jgi:hypothetical protein